MSMWQIKWFSVSDGTWEGLAAGQPYFHYKIRHEFDLAENGDTVNDYLLYLVDDNNDEHGIRLGRFDNLPSAQLCAERVFGAIRSVGERIH